ncbi:aldose 1-epimerase family protein [Agrobacterium fabrum]|uniref:aldose 1-epimerase family protein n=1 Tax=Agrobacterium fabrum TaxID=1176649 RepID=UPI001571A698|nr:aldose 1-epimerase family protein [Agrobacterium fabrum]WCK80129.1 aldose 1-epimerase family protein [Agrobacterium fabrum]
MKALEQRTARELSPTELRQRTVDGRGVADIRLLQVEDGPGRGQRLLVMRNASGIGLEIAPDRGFDISSATWRGINVGWNSANGLPWPMNSVDAEDGVGFYRNLDGFLVTCGLDHIGGARRSDASHFIHKHRKEVFHPLHGRISGQRAMISGYGVDWKSDTPVIWAEGTVKQSSIFGENLVLRRRISLEIFSGTIRVDDTVENLGFRPSPHAILYHINFGYPFLDEATQIDGDIDEGFVSTFNGEDKSPRDDFVDYFQEIPVISKGSSATIEVRNDKLAGGLRAMISFPLKAMPDFGIWRAFQSGVYALALEPMKRSGLQGEAGQGYGMLEPGEAATYWLELRLVSVVR